MPESMTFESARAALATALPGQYFSISFDFWHWPFLNFEPREETQFSVYDGKKHFYSKTLRGAVEQALDAHTVLDIPTGEINAIIASLEAHVLDLPAEAYMGRDNVS